MSYEMKMDAEMVRRHQQEKGSYQNSYLSSSNPTEKANVNEKNKPYYESTIEFQKYLNMILAQSNKDAADVDWNLLAQYSECMLAFAVKNAEIGKQIGAGKANEENYQLH